MKFYKIIYKHIYLINDYIFNLLPDLLELLNELGGKISELADWGSQDTGINDAPGDTNPDHEDSNNKNNNNESNNEGGDNNGGDNNEGNNNGGNNNEGNNNEGNNNGGDNGGNNNSNNNGDNNGKNNNNGDNNNDKNNDNDSDKNSNNSRENSWQPSQAGSDIYLNIASEELGPYLMRGENTANVVESIQPSQLANERGLLHEINTAVTQLPLGPGRDLIEDVIFMAEKWPHYDRMVTYEHVRMTINTLLSINDVSDVGSGSIPESPPAPDRSINKVLTPDISPMDLDATVTGGSSNAPQESIERDAQADSESESESESTDLYNASIGNDQNTEVAQDTQPSVNPQLSENAQSSVDSQFSENPQSSENLQDTTFSEDKEDNKNKETVDNKEKESSKRKRDSDDENIEEERPRKRSRSR